MSDEQKMPDVIYARPAGKWVRLVVAPDDDDTPYLRCPDNIDPDDAVVVKRVAVEKMRVGILEKGTTIATLTAERDAERASAMAFHVELQRLRMWCGEFVSRIEQRGVVGISDDADLVDIFREAALAQLKEQADD